MSPTKKDDAIEITKAVKNRVAYPTNKKQRGTKTVSLRVGEQLEAATDEIAGCVFCRAKTEDNVTVIVPLHPGEWKLVA